VSLKLPLCWHYSGLVTPERLCTSEFLELLDGVYENHNLNRLVVDEVGFPRLSNKACLMNSSRLTVFQLVEIRIFFVLASNLLFPGMGPRFSRRISTHWEIPRALFWCSNHGSYCDCHSGVSRSILWFIHTKPSPSVQKDIISSLKFDQTHLFVALHPFNRENLFYEVWSPNQSPGPNRTLSPYRSNICPILNHWTRWRTYLTTSQHYTGDEDKPHRESFTAELEEPATI